MRSVQQLPVNVRSTQAPRTRAGACARGRHAPAHSLTRSRHARANRPAWTNGLDHAVRGGCSAAGSAASAALHLARTVCRRAERTTVYLAQIEGETVSEPVIRYLNRLSDLLFVASRWCNDKGKADVLWKPGATR